jgi:hypothetical protein
MEYKSYSSDMDKILYSPYFAALSARKHGKSDADTYLDGKDSLTRRLAEKYGAERELTKALLYARELGNPPLGDVGEKFMRDELGTTPLQASVAIANDLGLSPELVGELQNLDSPSTKEGIIVNFVNTTCDRLPILCPSIVDKLYENIRAENGKLQLAPEYAEYMAKLNNESGSKLAALHDQKEMSAIRDKLAPLGGGVEAVLGLQMLADGDFKISTLPKNFAGFVKDRTQQDG